MKKLLALFTAVLVAAPLFAQDAQMAVQIKHNLKKHVPVYVDNNADVLEAFEQFKQEVKDKNYYDYGLIFQSMDKVRNAYMTVHNRGTIRLRATTAEHINQPVAIANGQVEITLYQYINMENINLQGKEPEKFEAFSKALGDDLRLAQALREKRHPAEAMSKWPSNNSKWPGGADMLAKWPVDMSKWPENLSAEGLEAVVRVLKNVQDSSKDIKATMTYPQDAQDTTAISRIFQPIVNMMADYNSLRAVDMKAAHAVGAYMANERFVTKDGKSFEIEGFFQMFAGSMPTFTAEGSHGQPSLYQQLDDFKDHLREDAVMAHK